MKNLVLDTSVLIRHWRQSRGGSLHDKTPGDAEGWARKLVEIQDTDAIVTPVAIEFVAGVVDPREMRLAQAYLGLFEIVDRGRITEGDWKEARRLAERIPREPRPRGLVDCLIAAIAGRLRHDVFSLDRGMPRMKSVKRKRN